MVWIEISTLYYNGNRVRYIYEYVAENAIGLLFLNLNDYFKSTVLEKKHSFSKCQIIEIYICSENVVNFYMLIEVYALKIYMQYTYVSYVMYMRYVVVSTSKNKQALETWSMQVCAAHKVLFYRSVFFFFLNKKCFLQFSFVIKYSFIIIYDNIQYDDACFHKL